MSVQIKSVVRPTQLVRNVMYKHESTRGLVFTNKYKTCRTVKCYFDPKVGAEELISDITSVLQTAGVQEFKIKTLKYTDPFLLGRMCYTFNSLIVRIPFSEQAQ